MGKPTRDKNTTDELDTDKPLRMNCYGRTTTSQAAMNSPLWTNNYRQTIIEEPLWANPL